MNRIGKAIAALALFMSAGIAAGQVGAGTALTYQGELKEGGSPASGVYDMQFTLYTDSVAGSQVGFSQFISDVPVTEGRFSTKVNFGPQWNGSARWVQIAVRPGASTGSYTPMLPRQELTPAPYAMGLVLPMSEAQPTASHLMWLQQTGAGNGIIVSSGAGDAIDAATSGAGDAVYAHTTGTGSGVSARADGSGSALFGYVTGTGYGVYGQSTNGATSLFGYNLGIGGYAGLFRTESSANPATCLEVQQNGTGYGLHVSARASYAGYFENTNASNTATTLRSLTNGAGPALWARTTGTGRGALIEVSNSSSTANALEVNNLGDGLAAKFTGGDVQIWGRAYATIGTVLNRATPVAWGTMDWNGDLVASSGNVSMTYLGNSMYRALVVGEGEPETWTVVTDVTYDSPDGPGRTYDVRAGKPQAIQGQPGNGSVRLHIRCVEGCNNEFGTAYYVNFVVYKGV